MPTFYPLDRNLSIGQQLCNNRTTVELHADNNCLTYGQQLLSDYSLLSLPLKCPIFRIFPYDKETNNSPNPKKSPYLCGDLFKIEKNEERL